MPQIGWFELLILIIISILVLGPKEFPIVLRKIGNFIGSTKRYFSNIQNKMNNLDDEIQEDISVDQKFSKKTKDKNNE